MSFQASGSQKFAAISAATSGNNTLVGLVAGKKVRVLELLLIPVAAVTVRFESGADGTALTGVMTLSHDGGGGPRQIHLQFSEAGHFETAAGALLNLELGGAVQCSGYLVYQEVN